MATLRYLLFGAALCVLVQNAVAQNSSCSGNVTISSQADVTNNPKANCTAIGGELIFANATGNISFPDDYPLTQVNGSVLCINNTGLVSLELGSLKTISSNLWIQNNSNLAQVSMPALQRVDFGFIEDSNFALLSPGYFPNLTYVFQMDFYGPFGSLQNVNDSFPELVHANGGIVVVLSSTNASAHVPVSQCDLPTNFTSTTPQSWTSSFTCNTTNSSPTGTAPGARVGFAGFVCLVIMLLVCL